MVAAWSEQRRSTALRPDVPGPQQMHVLRAMVLLEELTRRQLVAFTPDQLGFVFRWVGGRAGARAKQVGEWEGGWTGVKPVMLKHWIVPGALPLPFPVVLPKACNTFAASGPRAGAMSWLAAPPRPWW